MFQVHSFGLPANRLFRRADVVHYHVVHDGFFSIAALPVLARLKPSIWTWHDPWIMTGHCMHPMECDRWRIGCGECPDLTRTFEMKFDNTRRAFALKRAIVRHSPIDIIVASRWMLDMARASPMAVGARLHYIPFGVDLSRFKPRDQAAAKARFGVLPDRVVVAVRGFISPYKGVRNSRQHWNGSRRRCVCCRCTTSGGFDRLIGRHQVIGLDWTDDEDALIDAYAATDIFVMPSMGEAFGMMAVEAMACGKPVVVFEGTALPDVTFAPEAGIAVPMRDVQGLADAVQHLVDDAPDRLRRGKRDGNWRSSTTPQSCMPIGLTALYQAVAKGSSRTARR